MSGTDTPAVFSFPSVETAHWAGMTGRTVHMHEGAYTWVWCSTPRGGLMLCWWVDVWRLIPEWKLFISTIIDSIFLLWCCMVYWKKAKIGFLWKFLLKKGFEVHRFIWSTVPSPNPPHPSIQAEYHQRCRLVPVGHAVVTFWLALVQWNLRVVACAGRMLCTPNVKVIYHCFWLARLCRVLVRSGLSVFPPSFIQLFYQYNFVKKV